MNENEFMRQQRAAVERMREMNQRAIPGNTNQPMPPVPPFVRLQNSGSGRSGNYQNSNNSPVRQSGANQPQKHGNEHSSTPVQRDNANMNPLQNERNGGSLFGGLNLPFLDMFSKDGDASLIIGLLLILMSEKADKKLLFALIYILM